MNENRKIPKASSPKIVVDSIEAKQKLIDICNKKGENIRETVVRLIKAEHRKEFGDEN